MIFPFRLIESPNRYAMHLPADMPATTLAEAAKVMEQQFGEPAQATLDGDLIELHHGSGTGCVGAPPEASSRNVELAYRFLAMSSEVRQALTSEESA